LKDRLPARIYFSTLLEINNILGNNSNPVEQFTQIFKAMKKIVPFDLLSIYNFKKDINKLELIFNCGRPKTVVESVNFKLGKGGTWHAVKTRKPYLIKNNPDPDKPTISSFTAIPILFQEELIGVLSLGLYGNYAYQKLDIILAKIITSALTNLLIFLRSYADSSNES